MRGNTPPQNNQHLFGFLFCRSPTWGGPSWKVLLVALIDLSGGWFWHPQSVARSERGWLPAGYSTLALLNMVSHILAQTCSHGGLWVPNVAGKQVSKCKCFSNLFVMFANVLLAIANHMHQLNQRWTDYSVTTCKSHREKRNLYQFL